MSSTNERVSAVSSITSAIVSEWYSWSWLSCIGFLGAERQLRSERPRSVAERAATKCTELEHFISPPRASEAIEMIRPYPFLANHLLPTVSAVSYTHLRAHETPE